MRQKLSNLMNKFGTVLMTRPTAISKFFRRRERQTAFALEKFFQALVAGTALAANDPGRDEIAQFAAGTPAFEPIFPTDGTFNRDAGDC
jgi:hypothetical protein